MLDVQVVTGSLSDERTVKLDQPVQLGSVKLRVTLEPLPAESRRGYAEVLAEIRERQRARGHQPRTREEVDAYIRQERDDWDR